MLYKNQGNLLFAPKPLDWDEQIVVITGGAYHRFVHGTIETELIQGASGVGELVANTLAVRNITVVVLDVNPIQSENCA
jgi:hypothetical protein